MHVLHVFVTYSGPVLPDKPQVVAEEGQNTDAEHGRHKKEKQDMEFGVSVWQLILGEETGEKESETRISDAFTRRIFTVRKEMRGVSCEPHHCTHITTKKHGGGGGALLKALEDSWVYLWAVLCRFPPAKL